jgi:hypothetical protein
MLYLLLIYIIAVFIRGHKVQTNPEYKFFIKGIAIKIIGALSFTMIYLFYYGDGDTVYYFEGARTLANIFLSDPVEYFELIFSSHQFSPEHAYIKNYILYAKASEEWLMTRVTSPIALLSMNRFFVAQILMSFFVFLGSWKMFQAFLLFYPKKQKEAFYAVFLVPSVIFWGSGILKDSVTFAFLSIFLFYTIKAFFLYQFKIQYYIFIALSIIIIFNIKAYIILSFIPVLLIAWVANNRKKIKSLFFRRLLTPFILVFAVIGGYITINNLQAGSEKYSVDNLQSRVKGFHSWHTTTGGSSYNLGEIEYTTIGILKKVPEALNVTYFRPFITEVSSAVTALGALESLFFLIMAVYILVLYRLKVLEFIYYNPFLIICFLYALIFGFIVGFTSYNFGALARYKIPTMPFFAFLLFYLYSERSELKKDDL